MAWLTVMAIILVFTSTWPRPKVTRNPTIPHCSKFISLVTSDMSGWRVNSDVLKYGLAHRDGHNHSSKYRVVACSVNLILSNLPNLVHRRLSKWSLLFAPVMPSRHVTDFFKYGLVHRDGNNLGIHVYLTTVNGYKIPNNNSSQQIHQPCNQWYVWMKSDLRFFEIWPGSPWWQ